MVPFWGQVMTSTRHAPRGPLRPLAAAVVLAGVVGCVPGAFHETLSTVRTNVLTRNDPVWATVASIEAMCPDSYPEIVTPLPEGDDYSASSDLELQQLLGNWHPAVRDGAAKELASRGTVSISDLLPGLASDSWMVRAGSAAALTELWQRDKRNWQELCPQAEDVDAALPAIAARYSEAVTAVICLFKDEHPVPRRAALQFLYIYRRPSRKTITAILQTCMDEDDYIAQRAMYILARAYPVNSLETHEVVPIIRKAMKGPLPLGRGSLVRLIAVMDEPMQRELIPELLAHLDWQPTRDTLYGARGQPDALALLTKLRVKELVPRLPRLLDKEMRGPGLFEPALKSALEFGAASKVILDDLKRHITSLQEKMEQPVRARARERYRGALRQKIEKVRKVVEHVEGL